MLLVTIGLLPKAFHRPEVVECQNVRLSFRRIVDFFFSHLSATEWPVTGQSQFHPTVRIGTDAIIGYGAVMGSGVEIGEKVSVGPNTVLANCTIGNRASIGANCSVGLAGFGFEKDETGAWWRFPHVGRVIIEDDVAIGSNTCIDRGGMGDTVIGRGTKIDNLVHIAHNVVIGENSLVIANSMIGGSSIIGDNVWIAPSVSVMNKVSIEDNSILGMGAVVIKRVDKNAVVVGNPARKLARKDD